jgi:hypothetical protein
MANPQVERWTIHDLARFPTTSGIGTRSSTESYACPEHPAIATSTRVPAAHPVLIGGTTRAN